MRNFGKDAPQKAAHNAPVPQDDQGNEELALLRLAGIELHRRGKCDFCGRSNVPVDFAPRTPTGDTDRPALICQPCAKTLT